MRKDLQWCVITDDGYADGKHSVGNLAGALAYTERGDPWPSIELMILGRVPVFTKGQLLLLNLDGREVLADARKPNKWDVEYETFKFEDYKKAVEKALEVSQA